VVVAVDNTAAVVAVAAVEQCIDGRPNPPDGHHCRLCRLVHLHLHHDHNVPGIQAGAAATKAWSQTPLLQLNQL